jgi:hypothetical protein
MELIYTIPTLKSEAFICNVFFLITLKAQDKCL